MNMSKHIIKQRILTKKLIKYFRRVYSSPFSLLRAYFGWAFLHPHFELHVMKFGENHCEDHVQNIAR